MSTDPRMAVETLREKIQTGDRDVSDADADALIRFSDQLDLLSSEYSAHRHLKLLRHCTRMSEHADASLADALEDRDAAEAIVRWINREYDNEETNRDYRSAIRVFGKRHERMDEPPETLAWVPTGTSSSYEPVPSERDLLTYENEIKPMIEACRNPRDAACLAVQFEGGFRSGEIYDVTLGSIVEGEHATGIHVDGKQGERIVHLVVAVPYLNRWLAEHPGDNDPTDPLWTKLGVNERQSYSSFLSNFKVPAKRADVAKDVTPTNLRRSNTRWLVIQDLSQARIEDRQGRQRGSEHTQRYLARFGSDSNERAYAALHGLEVDEPDDQEYAPLVCPRCDKETPRDQEYCVWCAQALSPKAAEQAEAVDDRLFDSATEVEDATAESHLRTVRRAATPPIKGIMAREE